MKGLFIKLKKVKWYVYVMFFIILVFKLLYIYSDSYYESVVEISNSMTFEAITELLIFSSLIFMTMIFVFFDLSIYFIKLFYKKYIGKNKKKVVCDNEKI